MPNITHLQPYGNQIALLFDDGTRKLAYPTLGGMWIVSGVAGGGTIDPPPTTNPLVIYPTDVHTVSDSFQDHVDRGSVNPGTDYTDAVGDNVYSVADGIVIDADNTYSGSGGRTIHIDHTDGSGADYLHLSQILCTVGATVKQGDIIAKSGASGYGSETYYGPHLHISYRNNHSHGYVNDGNIDFDALIKSL